MTNYLLGMTYEQIAQDMKNCLNLHRTSNIFYFKSKSLFAVFTTYTRENIEQKLEIELMTPLRAYYADMDSWIGAVKYIVKELIKICLINDSFSPDI